MMPAMTTVNNRRCMCFITDVETLLCSSDYHNTTYDIILLPFKTFALQSHPGYHDTLVTN